LAIFIFSGVINIGSSSKQKVTGQVSIWGTYSQAYIQPYLDAVNIKNQDIVIRYEQKNPDTFENDLISALANRNSPDIVISDSEHIFSFRDKVYVIPYTTYTERLYRDSFVDGASIFLSKEGVLAIPLTVDPLVLYYNKNLLAGQNYVFPPTTWTGLVQSLPKFVRKDSRGVITQTAIGLGETDNVNNFDDILSALFLQTGNPIISINPYDGRLEQKITISNDEKSELGTVKALDFYTSFANQASTSFSWTRNLPSTLDSFLAGKSAFYIGRASELFNIQTRNPNLSFDVTTIFQPEVAARPVTYGVFTGAAVLKSTTNFPAAYNVLGI
jgi:ABC-type glycerol-3-phosphate transport system substrate-binding protein